MVLASRSVSGVVISDRNYSVDIATSSDVNREVVNSEEYYY